MTDPRPPRSALRSWRALVRGGALALAGVMLLALVVAPYGPRCDSCGSDDVSRFTFTLSRPLVVLRQQCQRCCDENPPDGYYDGSAG